MGEISFKTEYRLKATSTKIILVLVLVTYWKEYILVYLGYSWLNIVDTRRIFLIFYAYKKSDPCAE